MERTLYILTIGAVTTELFQLKGMHIGNVYQRQNQKLETSMSRVTRQESIYIKAKMYSHSIGTATSGSTVFTDNTKITTFKELIYFVNVKTFGRYFVAGCSNLTEIHIPASVTTFGTYAFVNTPKMKKIYCYPATAPATNTGTFANATSSSMGYDGRNAGANEFHVPVGATGYDSGLYSSRLQNTSYCGFTVIYDL